MPFDFVDTLRSLREGSSTLRGEGERRKCAACPLLLPGQTGAFFALMGQKTYPRLRFVKSRPARSGETGPLQGGAATIGTRLECAALKRWNSIEGRRR